MVAIPIDEPISVDPWQGEELTRDEQRREMLRCAASREYFIRRYVRIYDPEAAEWIPFDLWDAQVDVLERWENNQLNLELKARQMGLTWLGLSYGLHGLLFRPIYELLIFSKREDEAIYLLSEERLRGMYKRLPRWMQAVEIEVDAATHFRLSNGSGARAFPSNAGDSYTATQAIIDEADLVPDLGQLLGKVKPTIDAGGQLMLISRVDKSKPQSRFKQIYRAAKAGNSSYSVGFLPWHAHPGRTQAWYDQQKRDILQETGALDDLHEQYPATDLEALSPKTLDKRIAPAWLNRCYVDQAPLDPERYTTLPSIPGLKVYKLPELDRQYVIGIDPAEGNPTSDDSALTMIDSGTQEEIAMLAGKFQPSVIAAHADTLGQFYNNATIMPERNNHGHAVILWFNDHSPLTVLDGPDGKPGWHSTTLGKTRLYDAGADAFKNQETTLHSFDTFTQLQSIEGSTLRAPEGEMDDKADSFVLALVGNQSRGPDWDSVII